MKALKINDTSLFDAGIFSGHWFEDNGGTPDGPSWLSTDVPEDEAAQAIETGMAQTVEVRRFSVEAMARYIGFAFDESAYESPEELRDWIKDTLFMAVDDKFSAWAYYDSDEMFLVLAEEVRK